MKMAMNLVDHMIEIVVIWLLVMFPTQHMQQFRPHDRFLIEEERQKFRRKK